MIDITAWVMQTIVILISFLLFEEHNTVISIKGFQTKSSRIQLSNYLSADIS